MRILFDHSAPSPLGAFLIGHIVVEAVERGWHRLSNGDLLNAAEAEDFDVMVTADKNIRYQQNLSTRRIAIIELSTPRWPVVRLHVDRILAALTAVTPGGYLQVDIPMEN